MACRVGALPHPDRRAAVGASVTGRGRAAMMGRPEGWQNGNAPVLKTGAREGLWVRIPPPPLLKGATRRGARRHADPYMPGKSERATLPSRPK